MVTVRPASRFIAVDRHTFRLYFYKRPALGWKFKLEKYYPIAVGMLGHKTPPGLYSIFAKVKDPDWYIPNEEWVQPPEDRGKVIPGGDPRNPIKSRYMKLTEDGVGIHGTADEDSLGSRASHGCIRMKVRDVKELYHDTPKHTLVYIV